MDGRQPIPYGRQSLDRSDRVAVDQVLESPRLTQGPQVEAFEAALAEYCGAAHAVVVSNGTAALHLAALVADLGPGRSGLTTPLTFLASANCLVYAGARPLFADIDPDTLCLDPGAAAKVCQQARAEGRPVGLIVAVDFAGAIADLAALRALADAQGALLVEDAAHSLGASYDLEGRTLRSGCCRHAHLATLSFHPVKHITTGEGGAVLTNDPELARRLRRLREHGIERGADPRQPWLYTMTELGFNYRLTDIQCALGLSQLRRLDGFLARRREIAAAYDRDLAAPDLAAELAPPPRPQGQNPAWHLYVIRLRPRPGEDCAALAERRRRLFVHLHQAGIQVQVHYIPVNSQPYYRQCHGCDPADTPHCQAYYAACISLPIFPDLDEAQRARVVAELRAGLAADQKGRRG